MATEERFAAVITIQDQTAAALAAIGARFQNLSRQSGLTRLGGAVAGVTRAMGGLLASVLAVAGPMAAIGATGAIGGLAALAVRTASLGDDLGDLAAATGVPIQQLEGLIDVAMRAGVSQESLAGSLQKLNRGMVDAATGGNADLAAVFRRLGIAMRGADGSIRSASDVLPQLAQAFSRIEDPALQTRLAVELFGRAGAAMIPMLQNGAAGLREGQERFQRYGFSLASVSERMSAADSQFKNFSMSVSGLGNAVGAELAPILGPIAEDMAKWVVANRDWIATGIGEQVKAAAEAVRGFFAENDVIARMQEFAREVGSTVESLGGLKNIMIGAGAVFLLPFAGVLASVVTAFTPLIGAVYALGTALLTTPVGWIIGGLVAIGFAAYKLWQNWDDAVSWMTGAWNTFREALAIAWENSPLARFLNAAREGFEALGRIVRPVAEAIARVTGNGAGTAPEASSNPAMNAPAQAQRRLNFGNRAQRFDDDGNLISPLAGGLPESPLAAAPRPQQEGRVQVDVNINGAPPGTRVEATSSGALVERPRTDVGYSLGGGAAP